MTPLPAVIRKAGFELRLVLRNGRVAIYRQHQPGSDPNHDAYEVILPQVRSTNHKGERVGPYEAFPSAESWGIKGWTFTNLEKAFEKLLQLRMRALQKASCARTVSRRNRFSGQRRLETRPANQPLPAHVCSEAFCARLFTETPGHQYSERERLARALQE
jgi:hypothetical protein